jgi:hypothetical protein
LVFRLHDFSRVEVEGGELLPGELESELCLKIGFARLKILHFRRNSFGPQNLRALEQRLLQIVSYRCCQIFAFGVRHLTAVENGDHFSLGNGIPQAFAHLYDRAFHPSRHTCDAARIKRDHARHAKHSRKNALSGRGDLDPLGLDLWGLHIN